MHIVSVTGIIVKDGKYLIVRRSEKEKFFAGKWTVPGGKLDEPDYNFKKDTGDAWYNILERVLRREIKEETNLEIKNIGYVTSLTVELADKALMLVLSFDCDYAGDEIELSDELSEYAWISAAEAKNYDLIEGIEEEIEMADKKRKGEKADGWSRK